MPFHYNTRYGYNDWFTGIFFLPGARPEDKEPTALELPVVGESSAASWSMISR